MGYCCHMHSLHTVTSFCHKSMKLFHSCHWPLGGLSDQSPPWSSSLKGWPDLGRVLVVPFAFHFLIIALTVLQGIFKAFEIFLYPYPDLCLSTTLSTPVSPVGLLKAPWCSWLSLCCEMHYPREETYRNS